MPDVKNILTVDLEEWFVVEVMQKRYAFEDWRTLTSTVVPNTHRLLELFERKGVHATFFVLGYCADRFPNLMREIADHGHEVACHSYQHVRVDRLTPEAFRRDTERALGALEKALGFRPVGYRAPSWSLNARTPWAFEILADLGFQYDSSIFPIKHDLYGVPNGPRRLFRMTFDSGKTLWELPCATARFWGQNMPMAGGGYLRHSPYWYTKLMIRRLNKEGMPAMVYIHPWEVDPDPPQVTGLTALQRFRMYSSTAILTLKLERLLSDFDFISASDYIRSQSSKRIGFERV